MAAKSLCKIEGCDKPAHGLGWCSAHLTRYRRNGDPLVTKRIPNGSARAKIDEFKASQTDDCLEWPYSRHGGGYGQCGDGCVHRIICIEVHGEPPSPDHYAAHKCGNAPCCNPHHLYWATPKENQADRVEHGTSNRGQRQWRAQLSESIVREMRRMAANGMKHHDIAARFGVSRLTATKAISRYTWAWVE